MKWLSALAVAAALLGAPGSARAGPPDGRGADADAGGDATESRAPVCAPANEPPAGVVADTFSALSEAFESRIPGPAGEPHLRRRVDAALARVVDVDIFAQYVLRGIWEHGAESQRLLWRRALERLLRARYLKSLGSPAGHTIEVTGSDVVCAEAEVRFLLRDRRRAGPAQKIVMSLAFRDGAWRVYDVAVDGVSLAHTWRSRFQRFFADGGLRSIDHQMRLIDARYGPDSAGTGGGADD